MKIAYMILVHEYEKNVKFLINHLLEDKEAELFIHVDKTVSIAPFYIVHDRVHYIMNCAHECQSPFAMNKRRLLPLTNAHYIRKKRKRVTWGGYSMIKATFALIGAARLCSPDYYCLLSGRDFLIKDPLEWKNMLSASYPFSYIDGEKIVERWTARGLDRVHYHFFYLFKNKKAAYYQNRIVRRVGHLIGYERKMPYDLVPYCGSQWWTISDRHMHLIFGYLHSHKKYTRFYHTVGIPDEQFFQTILYNSHLKNELINRSQTYVFWINGFVKEFTPEDSAELKNKEYVFARKIKYEDTELQEMLAQQWK